MHLVAPPMASGILRPIPPTWWGAQSWWMLLGGSPEGPRGFGRTLEILIRIPFLELPSLGTALGPLRAVSGLPWDRLGPPSGCLGAPFGFSSVPLEQIRNPLWSLVERSWGGLRGLAGRSWESAGFSWTPELPERRMGMLEIISAPKDSEGNRRQICQIFRKRRGGRLTGSCPLAPEVRMMWVH